MPIAAPVTAACVRRRSLGGLHRGRGPARLRFGRAGDRARRRDRKVRRPSPSLRAVALPMQEGRRLSPPSSLESSESVSCAGRVRSGRDRPSAPRRCRSGPSSVRAPAAAVAGRIGIAAGIAVGEPGGPAPAAIAAPAPGGSALGPLSRSLKPPLRPRRSCGRGRPDRNSGRCRCRCNCCRGRGPADRNWGRCRCR